MRAEVLWVILSNGRRVEAFCLNTTEAKEKCKIMHPRPDRWIPVKN